MQQNQVLLTSFTRDDIKGIFFECFAAIERSQPKTIAFNERPLTIDQASEFTGLAKPTLYSMASQGRIPCSRRGKRLIFLESELITWIKEGRKKQQP